MSGDEREPWESDPEAWRGDDVGDPPIEDDEFVEVEDWGVILTVPSLELQIHEDLDVVVAVVGPAFREMVSKLVEGQDRLAWSLTDDSTAQRKNIYEALLRSLKLTPLTTEDEENDDA